MNFRRADEARALTMKTDHLTETISNEIENAISIGVFTVKLEIENTRRESAKLNEDFYTALGYTVNVFDSSNEGKIWIGISWKPE